MKSSLPTIAIVTPSFNQAQYLEECIESVLGQGYHNLQYVIMDGGSTDGSLEIIQKYAKYLTYWQSQPDGGQYNAITDGFRRTNGEIMAWLNSDDKYHPLAFVKVASTFTSNPSVRWLTGRMCYWGVDGDLVKISNNLPVFSRLKYLSGHFDKPYIQQESTFWHRSLWNDAGATMGNTEKLAGDLGLWCRFFRNDQLYTFDTCLGGYRLYGDQRGVLMADGYYNEASLLIEQERKFFRLSSLELPSPPNHLSVSREPLISFLADNKLNMEQPSLRTCWRHYTENLIGMVNEIYRERDFKLFPFLHNELMMLGLVKPSAITLTTDRLEESSAKIQLTERLRKQGDAFALNENDPAATVEYRKALDQWPTDTVTAVKLLRVLWQMKEAQEALNLIVRFLEFAAHDREFVQAAAAILVDYGAIEQATGVYDEYLMTNPHDFQMKSLREQL